MSKFRSLRVIAVLAVLTFALCLSARASVITTGGSFAAPAETDPTGPSLTVVGGPLVSGFSVGGGPTLTVGTLTTTVYKNDTSNPFGGLTFTYQIAVAPGSTPVTNLTDTDFTNYLTDVSYQASSPNVAPTTVTRTTADAIGWRFQAAGNGQVGAGSLSSVLVVQTNAPSFGSIAGNVLGGATATPASLGPVPEPTSLAFLGTSAVLLYRRRR
jgi:hypothetical protein